MDFIDMRLREYFAHNPGCESCKYRNCCAGGCRGHVAAVGGGEDLLARDEDTCKFFQKGWHDKLVKLMEDIKGKKQQKDDGFNILNTKRPSVINDNHRRP